MDNSKTAAIEIKKPQNQNQIPPRKLSGGESLMVTKSPISAMITTSNSQEEQNNHQAANQDSDSETESLLKSARNSAYSQEELMFDIDLDPNAEVKGVDAKNIAGQEQNRDR